MTNATDPCAHLSLPETAGGATLRQFIRCQAARDGAAMAGIFAEDVVFNGLLYQEKGAERVVALYTGFLPQFIASYAVEAIAPAAKGQWLMLTQVCMKGADKPFPIVDLVTLDDTGKICRLDNCFNTKHVQPPAPPADAPPPQAE